MKRTMLVVGASSGIAARTVIRMADPTWHFALVARRPEELAAVAAQAEAQGATCSTFVADARDAQAMTDTVRNAVEALGHLDIAWLNVGQGPDQWMQDVSVSEVHEVMDLNYSVTANALVPVLEVMLAAGAGHVVHTNSLAGLIAVPRQGPYGAAKVACRHLIDTARAELEPRGLRFTSLYPGFVATERIADDGLPKPFQIDVDTAADHVIAAITKQKRDAAFPWQTASLVRALRLAPTPIRNLALRRLAR